MNHYVISWQEKLAKQKGLFLEKTEADQNHRFFVFLLIGSVLQMEEKLKQGVLLKKEELDKIRNEFYHIEKDKNGNKRLYFDNAGGSFRLKKVEDVFFDLDSTPDCSERDHAMARYLQQIEEKGKEDVRTIFNATGGSIATSLTASQLMFQMVATVAEHVEGSNMVTTILEHPSAFDAMTYYADKMNKELRVAKSNPVTGGVAVEEITSLIDKNTCLLTVMYASNISGTVYDIEAIVKEARRIKPDIYIVVDAVQHAPHGVIDLKRAEIDAISFAPYKFFGMRGLGVAYLSDRMASLPHHKLLGKGTKEWELGSPAPAQYAAITEIVNYVCSLAASNDKSKSRRELFVQGMTRITLHERALLNLLLEGTDKHKGLRYMKNVKVLMDNMDLTIKDLIIGIEIDNIDCSAAVKEYEKKGVIVYERVATSIYSARMLESFNLTGTVRISPLHCHSEDDINQFLKITQEIADSKN